MRFSLLHRRAPDDPPPESPPSLPDLGPAPELRGIERWINTPGGEPLALAQLRGKVVLVEFWAAQCGNCIRTLPFLRSLDQRYGDRGLTVIGVHTPELPMERHPAAVAHAVRRRGLRYPVALDPDFATWQAYGNSFWPTLYLIDAGGRLRYSQVGEGRYPRTEAAVQALLAEAA